MISIREFWWAGVDIADKSSSRFQFHIIYHCHFLFLQVSYHQRSQHDMAGIDNANIYTSIGSVYMFLPPVTMMVCPVT